MSAIPHYTSQHSMKSLDIHFDNLPPSDREDARADVVLDARWIDIPRNEHAFHGTQSTFYSANVERQVNLSEKLGWQRFSAIGGLGVFCGITNALDETVTVSFT